MILLRTSPTPIGCTPGFGTCKGSLTKKIALKVQNLFKNVKHVVLKFELCVPCGVKIVRSVHGEKK